MVFFFKILNRLNVLKYIQTTLRVSKNNNTIKIPLLHGLGLQNLNNTPTWMEDLLSGFISTNPSLTILDVGVNIGQTLLSIKSLLPDSNYIGFEPNPNCVYYVNKLIDVNKFKNSTVFPLAISNKIDVLDLYFNHDTDTTTTTLKGFRPNHYNYGFKQRVLSVDLDILGSTCLKLEHIDVIKIDIEGSELDALKGAKSLIKKYQPIIICEVLDTHSQETLETHKKRLQDLESFLSEIAYKIYRIHRDEADTKVVKYEEIETFEARVWNVNSLKLNDYLLVPHKNLDQLKTIFHLLN